MTTITDMEELIFSTRRFYIFLCSGENKGIYGVRDYIPVYIYEAMEPGYRIFFGERNDFGEPLAIPPFYVRVVPRGDS